MNAKTRRSKTYPIGNRHRSYLLRLWYTDGASWQASLVILENGKRLGFSSLEELFTFLMDQTNHQTVKGEN